MLGEMDILLLFNIISMLVLGKWFVWLMVFKVILLVKVLFLIMEIILKLFFFIFLVKVIFKLVEIFVEVWLVLKWLNLFLYCFK